MNPQQIDPQEFPTLSKYPQEKVEAQIKELQEKHKMSRQQCLVNLEMDLAEAGQLAKG